MVTRITLAEAEGLPDILSGENYRLNIGEIPGPLGGDTTSLSIKCQNAVIPGSRVESFEVSVGAYMRTFAGRRSFPRSLSVAFVEDITLDTYRKLRGWLEEIRGTETMTSNGNISDYSTESELTIFDQAGRIVDTATMYNFYIEDLQDAQVEVTGSQPIMINATFRYDFVRYSSNPTR